MFRLQTKHGAEHFLEACSREERDEWAAGITAAIAELQAADGGTSHKPPARSKLHDVNLRYTAVLLPHRRPPSRCPQRQLSTLSHSKVLDSMYDVHCGIKLTNHVEQGNTYSNCFSGEPSTFSTFTPHTDMRRSTVNTFITNFCRLF